MSGMEDQLGAILGDPVMMQKIQALAQSMGQSQPPGQPEKPERVVQPSPAGPGTGDLEMLKAFTKDLEKWMLTSFGRQLWIRRREY